MPKKSSSFEITTAPASTPVVARVSASILGLVTVIPVSTEAKSAAPDTRARELAEAACRTTAKISGLAALAPGPLGLVTVLPDVIALWKIQSQMVADIAAVYGKTATLGKEQMLYCLFKHSASQTIRDVVYRAGERYVVRPVSLKILQKVSTAVGIKISQRAIGAGVARFLPMVGAAAVAGYAYYDTKKVSASAIALFSSDIVFKDGVGD